MGALISLMRGATRPLTAFALPPRCPACATIVEADHRLCAACWGKLDFLGDPGCAICGLPFAVDRGAGACCGPCLAHPPGYDRALAAVAYGEVARSLVLRLKYARRLAVAQTMARLMQRRMPADADLILPVPLHRWRLWSRGFNQSALIGEAIGRMSGVAHDPLLLRRVKGTPVLRGLNAAGRRRAVAGAFACAPGSLTGRSVVLIDDVHTSGATAEGCSRTLKRAGAARVTLLCWARVLHRDGAGD